MATATRLDTNHHTFLQAIMKRGPLSEKATMQMYKSLVLATGEGFVQFLLAINKELEFVQLEVKKVMNQYDGKEFYGIINTLPSKEAKLGTQLTQAQILFFKAVMETIVQDPTASGVISSMKTMYLKLEPQQADSQPANTQTVPIKLSMQAREEALSLLVADQFLSRTEDGKVALGVKAFLELRSVFRNLEVPFCEICNEAAIKARLCSTRDCGKRIHEYCLARGLQSRNQRPKCSGCRIEWGQSIENEGPEDEERIEHEEYTEPIATQEPVQLSRKLSIAMGKRSVVTSDDEQSEGNGHDVDEDRRTYARSRMLRRKGSAPMSDGEKDEDLEENRHEIDAGRRTSKNPRVLRGKRSAPMSDGEEDEDLEESRREVDAVRRTSKKPRVLRRKRGAPMSDNEEDEDLEDKGHEGEAGRRTSRKPIVSRGKRSAPMSDGEEDEDPEENGHEVDAVRRTSNKPRVLRRKRGAPTSDNEDS